MAGLDDLDRALAQGYGAYASYANDYAPESIEYFGDGPADEVDRLLDRLAGPETRFLDLGCGAGFTLCRVAPQVARAVGFDQEAELLQAARLRAERLSLPNVTLILGNVAEAADVAAIPDEQFDLVLSRRGPNVNAELLEKMAGDALVIQELHQDSIGLLELFGRKTFVGDIGDNPRWLIDAYSWIGLFPVSIKEYYFEAYFRDADHLAGHLSHKMGLFSYPMPPMPYEAARDRPALELYARYHRTPRGIRVINHRFVYLFRRAAVRFAPADPSVLPAW